MYGAGAGAEPTSNIEQAVDGELCEVVRAWAWLA